MTMTADGTRPVAAPIAAIRQQQRREWTTLVEEIALLRSTDDQNALAMGDLFVEIEEVAGKQHLKVAAEQAGVEPIKAKQRHWVSRKIPPGHRVRTMMRESGLSFTHVRAIAGLERDPDMIAWAQRAIDNQWTAQRLREEIAASNDAQAKQGGVECACCHQELKQEDVIVTLRVDQTKQVRCCSHQCAIQHLQDDAESRGIPLTGRCRPGERTPDEAPDNVVQIPPERLNAEAREALEEATEELLQVAEVEISLAPDPEAQDHGGDPPAEDEAPEPPAPRRTNSSARLEGIADLADDPFAT